MTRLPHVVTALSALAILVSPAVDALGQARIGVYGDAQATTGAVEFVHGNEDFPTYSTATLYVVATDLEGGMAAYEYGFTGSFLDHQEDWFVLWARFGGPAPLNVDGCESPFAWGCLSGLGGCVEDSPFVLTEYRILAVEPLPSDLLLCADRGHDVSSFDGEPGYAQCDLESLTTFTPAPNPCYDVPDGCVVINPSSPCGTVDTPVSSFGGIKALYGG